MSSGLIILKIKLPLKPHSLIRSGGLHFTSLFWKFLFFLLSLFYFIFFLHNEQTNVFIVHSTLPRRRLEEATATSFG